MQFITCQLQLYGIEGDNVHHDVMRSAHNTTDVEYTSTHIPVVVVAVPGELILGAEYN